MKIDVLTLFPAMFAGPLDESIIKRARADGLLELQIHNLRDYAHDRHKTVDDRPFGGGEGMLMKCEPLFDAVESILPERGPRTRVLLLSAMGRRFDQQAARSLSSCEQIVLLCGRYEGVDERVAEHLADEEFSIGDYVLSGGELGAAVILDAVARLVPGVVGNEASTENESFNRDTDDGGRLLDCPQYTRPAEFRGWPVPETLLSGNHAAIERWRREAALEKTRRMRPDLLP